MFRTRRKANRYRNFGLLLLLGSFASFYFGFETSRLLPFLVGGGFVVGSFPLFQRYKIWRSGAKGEETVAKSLRSLGRSYHVFNDVVLPGTKSDIDHVVVGPTGVFVVETKNNNGTVSCNGDVWNQYKTGKKGGRYRGKIGSPSKQAKRNASMLGRLIGGRLKKRVFVNPVVVFANPKVVLNLDNPTVPVLRPQELCDFVESFGSKTLSGQDQKLLADLIASYSRYN